MIVHLDQSRMKKTSCIYCGTTLVPTPRGNICPKCPTGAAFLAAHTPKPKAA